MSRAIAVRSLARVMAAPAAARWLVILTLTACSAGSMSDTGAVGPSGAAAQNQTDLTTEQVCRQQVNQMVEEQNRPAIYAANSSLNSPYSANYQPDNPSRGLAGQFAYEQTLAACERNAGTGPDVPESGAEHRPAGSQGSLIRAWPVSRPLAAFWRNATRGSIIPAAWCAGPVRGCNGSPPTGWPGR